MAGDRADRADRDGGADRADRGPLPMSRRGFLGATGGLLAGSAVAGAGGAPSEGGTARPPLPAGHAPADAVPFYGPRQGGIVTPPQRHGCFAAFDLAIDHRRDLVSLLQRWTRIAADLCAGRPSGRLTGDLDAVEPDSGAALGLGPSRLTINVGFGPSLFGVGGPDRFGLRSRWPMALVEVPPLPGDEVEPRCAGGDLTVHACADDPQVAFHTVRQLTRAAAGIAAVRWAQAGFNESMAAAGTPRNLTGFKDGTANPTTDAQLDEFVWVGVGQDQEWMRGGTYVVARRIRILLEAWDAEPLGAQQKVIGRYKRSGAPLGRTSEHDPLDLDTTDAAGEPVIPRDAHVRLASPQDNWGQMLLRRSYSYDDGVRPLRGAAGGGLDAGLFFVAYQQNPRLAAIPILAKLARHDALRRFTVHTASAVAALPPGVPGPGHWIGEQLFD